MLLLLQLVVRRPAPEVVGVMVVWGQVAAQVAGPTSGGRHLFRRLGRQVVSCGSWSWPHASMLLFKSRTKTLLAIWLNLCEMWESTWLLLSCCISLCIILWLCLLDLDLPPPPPVVVWASLFCTPFLAPGTPGMAVTRLAWIQHWVLSPLVALVSGHPHSSWNYMNMLQ